MASWVPLEGQCKAGIGSAGGQQLCDPGTGGKSMATMPTCQRPEKSLWLTHWLQSTKCMGNSWYTEGALKDPQTIYSQIYPLYERQILLILSSHLFNFGEWFVTISLCTSNSKQREIIFNAQRKGSTFVRGLTLSALSYSKFFPLIKLWWRIRQDLDRLGDLFFVLEYTVILLWSSSCGNCLFIENWTYFEILMTGYTF